MEDEAHKMLALKMAYADIILNTAKEAGARVMVSERKAQRFQQDLRSVEDEALRMLLRLKKMIDSKMKEAELVSLCQKRKVEELEARLHEAEDVIISLRMQLKDAKCQLEKNGQVQPLEEESLHKISFPCKPVPDLPEPQIMSSNLKNLNDVPDTTNESTASQVGGIFSHDSGAVSAAARTKDHESYSCIQRIHELERIFLDPKLSLAIDVRDKQYNREIDHVFEKRYKEETGHSTRTGKKDVGKNVLVHAAGLTRPVKFHTLRRSKSQLQKYKTGSCELHGTGLIKSRQPSSILSRRNSSSYLRDGNTRSIKNVNALPSLKADGGNVRENSFMMEGHTSHKDENGIFDGDNREGKIKRGDLNDQPFGQSMKPCDKSAPYRTSINLINDSVKSEKYHSYKTENENKTKQLTGLNPGFTRPQNQVESTSVSTCVTTSDEAFRRHGVAENAADSNRELVVVPVEQGSVAPENSIFSSFQLKSEMNSNMKSEKMSEVTAFSPRKVDKKPLLKYNLQMDCKKKSRSISHENTSPEKRNKKRRLEEKLTCEHEFEKLVLVRKPLRENRQLSQAASQLISLSEKGR